MSVWRGRRWVCRWCCVQGGFDQEGSRGVVDWAVVWKGVGRVVAQFAGGGCAVGRWGRCVATQGWDVLPCSVDGQRQGTPSGRGSRVWHGS